MDAKTKLLAALALRPVPFTIEAAGAEVFLLPWPTRERQAFQALARAAGDGPLPDLYEQLFVRSVCDEAGVRLFADDEVAAARVLNGLALEEVALRVIELNGLEPADEKKAPSPASPS